MKKNLFKNDKVLVKVAKLKNNSLENGIVVFIAFLLLLNALISFRILFG